MEQALITYNLPYDYLFVWQYIILLFDCVKFVHCWLTWELVSSVCDILSIEELHKMQTKYFQCSNSKYQGYGVNFRYKAFYSHGVQIVLFIDKLKYWYV